MLLARVHAQDLEGGIDNGTGAHASGKLEAGAGRMRVWPRTVSTGFAPEKVGTSTHFRFVGRGS